MCRLGLLDEEHAVKINCGQLEAGVRKLRALPVCIRHRTICPWPQSRTKRTSTTACRPDMVRKRLGSGRYSIRTRAWVVVTCWRLMSALHLRELIVASWVYYTRGSRERVRSAGRRESHPSHRRFGRPTGHEQPTEADPGDTRGSKGLMRPKRRGAVEDVPYHQRS